MDFINKKIKSSLLNSINNVYADNTTICTSNMKEVHIFINNQNDNLKYMYRISTIFN
jgi:hypothetical protein